MNHAHQPVSGELSASATCVTELLPQDTTAPARARALIARYEGQGLAQGLVQDAAQVASELSANAVRHGQPPFRITITRERASLRIEVSQGDDRKRDTRPVIRADRFGLQLVAAMTQAWGTSLDDDGVGGHGARRTVWAQIESTPSGTSAARLGSPSQG